MQVPLELSFKDVPRIGWVDAYVKERVGRLDRMNDHIISCRVAIEREQHNHVKGNPYRARVEVTLPQKKDLIADKTGTVEKLDVQLRPIIRRAFEAMEKQIQKEGARLRGEVKHHDEPHALVVRLFEKEGYGFLKSPMDGEEYYFHRNAVLSGGFERLQPGTMVRFVAEMGEEGPQASSVQIIEKPGVSTDDDQEEALDSPEGWQS